MIANKAYSERIQWDTRGQHKWQLVIRGFEVGQGTLWFLFCWGRVCVCIELPGSFALWVRMLLPALPDL